MKESELRALDAGTCHTMIDVGYSRGWDDSIEVSLRVLDGPLAGLYFSRDIEVEKEVTQCQKVEPIPSHLIEQLMRASSVELTDDTDSQRESEPEIIE